MNKEEYIKNPWHFECPLCKTIREVTCIQVNDDTIVLTAECNCCEHEYGQTFRIQATSVMGLISCFTKLNISYATTNTLIFVNDTLRVKKSKICINDKGIKRFLTYKTNMHSTDDDYRYSGSFISHGNKGEDSCYFTSQAKAEEWCQSHFDNKVYEQYL